MSMLAAADWERLDKQITVSESDVDLLESNNNNRHGVDFEDNPVVDQVQHIFIEAK